MRAALGPHTLAVRMGIGIPAFQPTGVLPPGDFYVMWKDRATFIGHPATLQETHDRFVDAYPKSLTRPRLFNELEHLIMLARAELPHVNVCVSGTFVADIDDPTDIVVALIVPAAELVNVSPQNTWLLTRMFDRRDMRVTKATTVRTQLVRVWPGGHIRYDEGQRRLCKTRLLMGAAVVLGDDMAGYIEIMDSEGGDDNLYAFLEALAVTN